MPREWNRAGFALPMAILVIALLTAAIAAGFAATAGEAVSNNAQRAQERAYQLAQAGLEQFLVNRAVDSFCPVCGDDPAAVDSEYTRVPLTGGYADVVARRVRPYVSLSQPALFFIRSKGVDTTALLSGTGVTTFAERTVGIYASWNTNTMNVLAAMTTLNGVTEGSSASFSGNTHGSCAGDTSLSNDVVAPSGTGSLVSGSTDLYDLLSMDTLKVRTSINWAAIVNEGALTATVTIPSGTWPTSFTDWPVIRLRASYTLPTSGQGIIVADSDLVIPRTVDWDGIILVGGRLSTGTGTGSPTSSLHGAVVTGLNHLLPGSVMPTTNDDIVRADVEYHACNVSLAGQRLRAYSVKSNTWMDNVANW